MGTVDVGGVVGYNIGTIPNSYNTGDVTGSYRYIGGVVGVNSGGTITNSYNTGAVTGTGTDDPYKNGDIFVGGVAGGNPRGTIEFSYNTGAVNGTGDYVGGVAGVNDAGPITNSYNVGAVKGTGDYVGGVTGTNSGGTIELSYTVQKVTGKSCSGTACNGSSDPISEANMTSSTSFTGWSFTGDSPWRIVEGRGSPYLSWEGIENATVANPTYTGKPVSPTLYFGKTQLLEGTDYTIVTPSDEWDECTLPGCEATFSIWGKGIYRAGKEVSYEVLPAPLTVTVNASASRTYGEENPLTTGFTYTVSGFVNEEQQENVVTGTPKYSFVTESGEPVTENTPAGTHKIVLSGLAATNYKINYEPGMLTIEPAPLTVTVTDAIREYGREYGTNNPDLTYKLTRFVNGEQQADVVQGTPVYSFEMESGELVTETPLPVGTYKVHLSGLAATNYEITYVPGTLTVTPPCGTGMSVAFDGEAAGSATNPYQIANATQLAALNNCLGEAGEGKHFKLTANIVLNDVSNLENWGSQPPANSWTAIGTSSKPFRGTFDGDGHTVSGIYINTDDSYQGLFGYNNGQIQNVGVEKSFIKGGDYVGGVVGLNPGKITNSYNAGKVNGNRHVGGVIGYNNGIITESHNMGRVTGNEFVGGIVGNNYKTIVTEDNTTRGTIANSYNTGAVTGTQTVGGVAGYNYGGLITSSYNTGTVTGSGTNNQKVGGVAGANNNFNDYVGTITNSYNAGKVTGNQFIGGVAGANNPNSTITNSYNAGAVEGTNQAGGVVGVNYSLSGAIGTINLSYTVQKVTGSCSSKNCNGNSDAPIPEADMTSSTSFTGWTFTGESPWRIVEGRTSPYLSWQGIENATVANPTYTGNPVLPTLYFGNTQLVEGTDYTIVTASNGCTIAGCEATLSIWGNGIYCAGKEVAYEVLPAPLTVTVDDVTRTYGANEPKLTYKLSGFVNNEQQADVVTGTPVYSFETESGEPVTETPLPVGTYKVHLSGLAATNYAIAYEPGTLTVTQATYTIAYEENTGALVADGSYKGPSTEAVSLTEEIPTREGYTFAGWFASAELSGDAVTEIPAGSTGNKKFWASWTAIEYAITLHSALAAAELLTEPPTYTVLAGYTLPVLTFAGYDFDGWFADNAYSSEAVTAVAPGVGEKEFWAKWTEQSSSSVEQSSSSAVVAVSSSSEAELPSSSSIEAPSSSSVETPSSSSATEGTPIFANPDNPLIKKIKVQTVFDMRGNRVGNRIPTTPGVYIVRQGSTTKTVVVR
jgi:uncharacterized repeat protein (TIGR02543 family)